MQRIIDIRSFFGALSLLIVGLLISIGNMFYFNLDYFGPDVFMARWWWEILLNFQILCYAFMWFAHHNRIMLSDGRRKRRAIIGFLLGIFAVSGPLILLAVGAYSGWFTNPSSENSIVFVHYIFVGFWVLISWVMPGLQALFSGAVFSVQQTFFQRVWLWWRTYWIGILMIVLMIVGELSDYTFVYVLTPFLGYLQGALSYLKKSFRMSVYDRAY